MGTALCTFCKHVASLRFRVRDLNRRLSDERFAYYGCPACKLIFLSPHPDDLGKYYPQEYYGQKLALSDLEQEFPFNHFKVDIVRRFVPAGRLLEVGPSRGTFAYLAKKAGYDVSVIERDAECCEFLSTTAEIETINSTDPTAEVNRQTEGFDVIALWQVIEHLSDPWDFIRAAAAKLKPGGILVLATPNPDSLQFKIFGRFWFHLDAPRHLQLIPAALLARLGQSLGLREALLTASDADVHRHNLAGWTSSGRHVMPHWRLKNFAGRQMQRINFHLRNYERGDFRGTTYTLVLQKPA
jgi:2-polyprenyl-3-methyl-5-hydroxy-6-metoxy-1,4-benzoquinol methylase